MLCNVTLRLFWCFLLIGLFWCTFFVQLFSFALSAEFGETVKLLLIYILRSSQITAALTARSSDSRLILDYVRVINYYYYTYLLI